MARYDYRCRACGVMHEEILPMSSDPSKPVYCPACDKREAYRMASVGATFNWSALKRDRQIERGFVSQTLPAYVEGADQHDAEGQPIITSRKQAREIARRNGFHYD